MRCLTGFWAPAKLHDQAQVEHQPALTLPYLLDDATPPFVAVLGLGAIIGAVTSSFTASIVSAAMFSWNCCKRLLWHAARGVDAPYPVEFTNDGRKAMPARKD